MPGYQLVVNMLQEDIALGVCYAVGAVPDFHVIFAYLNFRLKGFPVSDFQQCDGYTESQRLM